MAIRQVLQSGENGLALCGQAVASVRLVALVRNTEHSSTKITYLLEDHTGQINAHYWLEEGDAINAPQIPTNSYAKVCGSVRSTDGGRKTLMIYRIEPLPNANEWSNHLLETLLARFKAEETQRGGGGGKLKSAAAAGGGAFGNGNFGGGSGGSDPGAGSLTEKQQAVYNAIKAGANQTPEGVNIRVLKQKFGHFGSGEIE